MKIEIDIKRGVPVWIAGIAYIDGCLYIGLLVYVKITFKRKRKE